MAKQCRVNVSWNGTLITGNWQTTLDNMKCPGGGTAIARGVVQHTVMAAGRSDQTVGESISTDRQTQFTGHTMAVQNQRSRWQSQRLVVGHAGKILGQERLDPLVNRWTVIAQQASLLAQTF